jgi:hypothetical protein
MAYVTDTSDNIQRSSKECPVRGRHMSVLHRDACPVCSTAPELQKQNRELKAVVSSEAKLNCELAADNEHLRAALQRIITEGDYTAPEGMKRIATEALGNKPPQVETTDAATLEQLWRIDKAAREFVEAFDAEAVQDFLREVCADEWKELNEALFDGTRRSA